MAELIELLMDFLCPTSNSASQCQSFFNATNHQVMMPFGPYIYFLFFPTVFLLLFLWIVFSDVIKANKGISLIATVAIFVFIIINGMYPVFLVLGELWIVVIILLGFLYMLTRRFRKNGGGGGGKGGLTLDESVSSASSLLGRKARGVWTGEEKNIEKTVETRMDALRKAAHNLEHPPTGSDAGRLHDSYTSAMLSAEKAIEELKQFNRLDLGVAGRRTVMGNASKYEAELVKISKQVGGRAWGRN
jgi:hypothetical protein